MGRLERTVSASDPKVVGRPVVLDGDAFTIIGVLPKSFDFGSIFAPGRQIDIFQPLPLAPILDIHADTLGVGRIKRMFRIDKRRRTATHLDFCNCM